MAFFYAPNDPSFTKPRTKHLAADSVVSLVTVLLLVAVAYGLYLLYAGAGPTERTACHKRSSCGDDAERSWPADTSSSERRDEADTGSDPVASSPCSFANALL